VVRSEVWRLQGGGAKWSLDAGFGSIILYYYYFIGRFTKIYPKFQLIHEFLTKIHNKKRAIYKILP
jgi:hypothetical protein